jgi:LPS O-antigen subunit length determinant protein (WzzB/FepE family)
MREVQKALAIRESDALLQLKSKLECLSASRDLDEAALAEAESVAEGLGIQVRPFIVKEVTEKDYQDYLADVAEEKMLIRRLIRLA